MWPFKPKAEVELQPGICECSHPRCNHRDGVGHCQVDLTAEVEEELRNSRPDSSWTCACNIYIRASDLQPVDPELNELKKIAGIE